jgi:hypothetical protein
MYIYFGAVSPVHGRRGGGGGGMWETSLPVIVDPYWYSVQTGSWHRCSMRVNYFCKIYRYAISADLKRGLVLENIDIMIICTYNQLCDV